MKTKMKTLKAASIAVIALMTTISSVNAQKYIYNTTWEDGRMKTRTKHAEKNSGLYEKQLVSQYSYDEFGNFEMKEVFIWNEKYCWYKNNWTADYSSENMLPLYRITRRMNIPDNSVILAYHVWNESRKTYGEPVERMIYRINEPYGFVYLAFEKDGKYMESINIYDEGMLLAKFIENNEIDF